MDNSSKNIGFFEKVDKDRINDLDYLKSLKKSWWETGEEMGLCSKINTIAISGIRHISSLWIIKEVKVGSDTICFHSLGETSSETKCVFNLKVVFSTADKICLGGDWVTHLNVIYDELVALKDKEAKDKEERQKLLEIKELKIKLGL